jgi:hypothetical protein
VWILCDLNVPLTTLRLVVADVATGRAEHIDRLDRSARHEGGRYDRIIRAEIADGVRGVRAPAATATNWPSMVKPDGPPLKIFHDSDKGICCYEYVANFGISF